jgi:hypothetical protein
MRDAIDNDNIALLLEILEEGANPNIAWEDETALWHATHKDVVNREIVNALLAAGAEIDIVSDDASLITRLMETPLEEDVINDLFSSNNIATNDTYLHQAVNFSNPFVLRQLLDRANPELLDSCLQGLRDAANAVLNKCHQEHQDDQEALACVNIIGEFIHQEF